MQPYRINARFLALLALGVVLLAVVWLANQRDALWLAGGVFALAGLALLWTRLPLGRLSVTRLLAPPRVTAGQWATVTLRLAKPHWGLPKLLRLQDRLPDELGSQPRFALSIAAASNWHHELSYQIFVPRRGRFAVGPLEAQIQDPMGLSLRSVTVGETGEVVAYPKTYPLTGLSAAGVGQLADAQSPSAGMLSQDDVLLRDYRIGDDVRRVHWRSTAKTGDLMVRREEQADRPTVRIAFDNRATRLRTEGAELQDAASPLEQIISVAASIAVAARTDGYRVCLSDASGQIFDSDRKLPYPEYADALLEAFVDIEASASSGFIDPLAPASRQPNIVVMASVAAADIATLATLSNPGLAIVIDPHGQPDSQARGELRNLGWRVLQLDTAEELPQLWAASAAQIGSRP